MHVQQCPHFFVLAVRIVRVAYVTYRLLVYRELRVFNNIMEMSVFFVCFLFSNFFKDCGPGAFFYLVSDRDQDCRAVGRKRYLVYGSN